jgi:hypothetical protein
LVFEPDGMMECLCPEVFGKFRMLKDSADVLYKLVVKRLGYTIVLGCVMHVMCGEVSNGAFLLKEFGEFMTGVLTVADDYQVTSSKLKLKQACQGQLKPDMEINHVLKLTYVECAELDTFIQDDNSSVTQR